MKKIKNRYFLIISFCLIVSDLIFISLNYHAAHETLKKDLQEWVIQIRQVFNTSMDAKAISMQQIATYVSSDPRVISLFDEGRRAVVSEGGGPGGERAHDARRRLYDLVSPGWHKMTERYDVRQLHFHLSPGSTSFLRVHRPDKFGDTMDDVRFTIVDANLRGEPTKGFETGRIVSGIRGVSPVVMETTKDINGSGSGLRHIGALEAGTSFSILLKTLKADLGCDFAVLLSKEHVEKKLWVDNVAFLFPPDRRYGDYFIESVTDSTIRFIINESGLTAKDSGLTQQTLITASRPYKVGSFPLRDYWGTLHPNAPPSGRVIVWKEAEERWISFQKQLKNNILFSLAALIVLETILFLVWHFSERKLKDVIERQTHEIEQNRQRLQDLVEKLPIGILQIQESSDKILEINAVGASLINLPKSAIVGRHRHEFIEMSKDRPNGILKMTNGATLPILLNEIVMQTGEEGIVLVSITDLTEHEVAQTERGHREKLQGVLELAGAVCHEVNQPLMILSGYIDLLNMKSDINREEYLELIAKIKHQVKRLSALTHKIMNITHYKTKPYLDKEIIDIDGASNDERPYTSS